MTFYGMQWLPTSESEVTPSEANPIEMIGLVRQIREAGEKASHNRIAEATAQYQQAFADFQPVQQEFDREEKAMIDRLSSQLADDEERRVVKTVGKMQYKNDPAFRDAVAKLDRSIIPLVHQYASYLSKKDMVGASTARLWLLYNTLNSTKATVGLWKFEADVAEKQKKQLEEELSLHKHKMKSTNEGVRKNQTRPGARRKKGKKKPELQNVETQSAAPDNSWLEGALATAGLQGASPSTNPDASDVRTSKKPKPRNGKAEGEAFF